MTDAELAQALRTLYVMRRLPVLYEAADRLHAIAAAGEPGKAALYGEYLRGLRDGQELERCRQRGQDGKRVPKPGNLPSSHDCGPRDVFLG